MKDPACSIESVRAIESVLAATHNRFPPLKRLEGVGGREPCGLFECYYCLAKELMIINGF